MSAGYHDFRIEFFQGAVHTGLRFSWEGPNVSKTTIPASAFIVSGDYVPQSDNLIHRWDFEKEVEIHPNDSIANDTELHVLWNELFKLEKLR